MIFNKLALYFWHDLIALRGMCVLICVILLVCVNAIAFLNFQPKCGAIIQTKLWPNKCMAQYRWNLFENVMFETDCCVWSHSLSLMSSSKMSRLRHAVYRHAHVSPNVLLENVMLETRHVSLCIVTLIIAHVSLMSRSILWPEYHSCHAMIFGTGSFVNYIFSIKLNGLYQWGSGNCIHFLTYIQTTVI